MNIQTKDSIKTRCEALERRIEAAEKRVILRKRKQKEQQPGLVPAFPR